MRPQKWTEDAIKQVFDGFINKYGRLPTMQEMYVKYRGQFPRPLSVKISLGITLGKFFDTYYATFNHRCCSRVYGKISKEYWIDNFKTQFVRLGMPSREQYDKNRDNDTPGSQTLLKIAEIPTWRMLLDVCGFSKDKSSEISCEIVFDETEESLRLLLDKLRKFL